MRSTFTLFTTPVFQRIVARGHSARTTRTRIINCQLQSPVKSRRSLQLGIAMWSIQNFQQLNRKVIVSIMKDEIFPQIPQEQTPQSHSMYEQLRRTSQKWFTRSHKRIFDGKSSYLHNDCSKISQSHQLIINHDQNNCQTPTDKMRMMQIMREQIEISCKQYSAKVKSLLQDQARKIKLLGDLLVKNQNELEQKTMVLDSIRASIMRFNQLKGNYTGSRSDVAEKKIIVLEKRLKEIEDILTSTQKETKIQDIERRIKSSLNQISQTYLNRLEEVRFQLEDRLDRAEKLNHLNMSTTKGVRTSSTLTKDQEHFSQILQRLQQQLNDLQIQVQGLQRKKFIYENYQLNQTSEKLQKMEKIISKIESAKKQQDRIQTRTWKGSQTTQLTHTEVNTMVKSTSKSRFINRYKSLINNRKQRQESYSSEEDSSESQVEATLVEDQESNVERFERVLGESKICKPVFIEVDQTGYVKSVDTGMYLVDGTGNGFQFTISELQYLKVKGVIEIM